MAAEWAGFQTVGQCEFADYPTKVLEKHWPDVPRWRDVRDVTIKSVRERIGNQRITLLSGGLPCQPFSCAGKRKSEKDYRYLWPETLRVISELGPYWVLIENVAGIDGLALDEILSNLEEINYETAPPLEIPACVFGAHHERYRIFIPAHSRREPDVQTDKGISAIGEKWDPWNNDLRCTRGSLSRTYWEIHQSPICGVDYGATDWMDRNKARLYAIGNMVVPQQVYPILKAIADIEKIREENSIG